MTAHKCNTLISFQPQMSNIKGSSGGESSDLVRVSRRELLEGVSRENYAL